MFLQCQCVPVALCVGVGVLGVWGEGACVTFRCDVVSQERYVG